MFRPVEDTFHHQGNVEVFEWPPEWAFGRPEVGPWNNVPIWQLLDGHGGAAINVFDSPDEGAIYKLFGGNCVSLNDEARLP